MAMEHKVEHLHIRASEVEKMMLAQAAKAKNMSVSQFLLQTTLPVAERIVREEAGTVQTQFRLSSASWAEFEALLDAPTRELPELKKLLHSKAPWDK